MAIEEGEVGVGGIGEESVLDDDDLVTLTLSRYKGAERRAVASLEAVVDGVVLHHLQLRIVRMT